MAKLPRISGSDAVRKFQRAGWTVNRQKGSHVMMTKPGVAANLSVPQHRELDRGLLHALIRGAGLTVEEFIGI